MVGSGRRQPFLATVLGAAAGFLLLIPGIVGSLHADEPPRGQLEAAELRPAPLEPGTSATVQADSCLRLRAEPGLHGSILTCLAPGRSVLVLAGTVERDGYRWQAVRADALTGWVADEFLEPYGGPPACDTARPSSLPTPGFNGPTPPPGGRAYVLWGGGTLEGVLTAAAARGCPLTAVWALPPGATQFVGYHVGAPAIVNRAWETQFRDDRIPVGSVLFVVCGGELPPLADAPAAVASVPLPAPWATAPIRSTTAPPPAIGAAAAIVVDEASGVVLYEKDAHTPLPPASLTKIATAVVALEGSDPDAWALAAVDSRRMIGQSLMGLLPGDCFRIRDLVRGLLLPSGNDAALALSRAIAGSDAAFVELLNVRLARLGLRASHFTDPHGLGGPAHRASAYDLAMLARYAMQLPDFAAIVGESESTLEGSRSLTLLNGNRFLTDYAGADGVKTGFTVEAGRTLVASAMRDGHRLYAVVLNAPDREAEAAALLDWAFANHIWPAAMMASRLP